MANRNSVFIRRNVTRFGEKVMNAMTRQSALPIHAGEKYKIGCIAAPKSVIEALMQHQLVQMRRDGAAVLTDIGEKFLRRRTAERGKPKGNAAKSGQPSRFAQQHQEPITAEIEIDGRRRRITRNMAEGPLGWLRRRRDPQGRPLINGDQLRLGSNSEGTSKWPLCGRS